MATVEMSFTPLPAHVRTARLVATAVARRSGVEEALLDEVRLAVGEACSRAVEAHQEFCPDEPVKVALTGVNGRFEVVVTDAAPTQAAAQQPAASGVLKAAGQLNGTMSASGGQAPGHSHAAEPAPAKGGSSDPASQSAQSDPASQPAQVTTADQQEPQDQEDQEAGDVLPAGLGLAMIAGLADDVQVSRTRDGLIITMSWPSVASAR